MWICGLSGRLLGQLTLADPHVSRVRIAATSPMAMYPLKSRAGPHQPNASNSSVVINGVKPETIAEIW